MLHCSLPKDTVFQSCLVTLFTCGTWNALREVLEIEGSGFANKNVWMAQTGSGCCQRSSSVSTHSRAGCSSINLLKVREYSLLPSSLWAQSAQGRPLIWSNGLVQQHTTTLAIITAMADCALPAPRSFSFNLEKALSLWGYSTSASAQQIVGLCFVTHAD